MSIIRIANIPLRLRTKPQFRRRIKRSLTRIALVLVLFVPIETPKPVTARMVDGWDYVYYANTKPTDLPVIDRWTFQKDPAQGKGSVDTKIANGQLHVTNVGKFEYFRTGADDSIIDSDSLTLEIRSKVVASPTCLDGPCLGQVFGCVYSLPGGGTRSGISIHVWQGKVIIEDPNVNTLFNPYPEFPITADYHTFRLTRNVSAGIIRVFVDGLLVWSGNTNPGSTSFVSPRIQLFFERDTESYVDYIAYTDGDFSPTDLTSPPLPFRLPFVGTYPISQGPGCGNHTTAAQAEAIDFAMPIGTPVYAADDGTVSFAGKATGKLAGYGNLVRIEHADGSRSYYAHLSVVEVARSSIPIVRGTLIGKSGDTGNATGPHLHFQVLDVNSLAVPIRTIEGITWVNPNDPCQKDAADNSGYATGGPLP